MNWNSKALPQARRNIQQALNSLLTQQLKRLARFALLGIGIIVPAELPASAAAKAPAG